MSTTRDFPFKYSLDPAGLDDSDDFKIQLKVIEEMTDRLQRLIKIQNCIPINCKNI